MKLPVVAADARVRAKLQQGHPWLYRDQLVPLRGQKEPPALKSGTWVRVLCGSFEGVGLWEAEGAIAVRLYAARDMPDAAWLAERVRAAWELRAPLREGGTTAYRWLYGESDGLPGIVADLYERYVALRLYAPGLQTLVEPLVEALAEVAPLRGIVLRQSGGASLREADEAAKVRVLWGEAPPRDLVVQERDLRFYANLAEGQKTGLFLDQRDNRAALRPWCRGREVLDCFCYTGGFALSALRGGAKRVTCVDIAPAGLRAAQDNLALNDYDPAQHEFVAADCFRWLEERAASGRRYDIVVLDPPSLAHEKANRYTAARAYTRLNRLALGCLKEGGLLASASCTSQVSPELFREALANAASQARAHLTIVHEGGQPLDHPVPAHFPEARYLKFVIARMSQTA